MISQIRKLMGDNHVTQRDLAHELGVSEQAISDKFHGRSNFTLRDVSRIADFSTFPLISCLAVSHWG